MAACLGLTLIKKFTYRGDPEEEWSNTYHLRDPPPSDSASWKIVADDIINLERACYLPTSRVVRAYGYNDDSEDAISVWTYDYEGAGQSVAGTLPGSVSEMAGDQAACISWRLDRKNTRGKYVYLRKYMHDGMIDSANPDALVEPYLAALSLFASTMAGTAANVHGGVRARTGTWPVIAAGTTGFMTTRTLRRRGKRPLG